MIYTSLAVLAMSASAAISPFSNLVHMHPHAKPVDTRINVTLYNQSPSFCELTVDGKTYTVMSHEELYVKAPAGTIVYAATRMPFTRQGDVVLELSGKVNNQKISID
jgi:hypothetical protein